MTRPPSLCLHPHVVGYSFAQVPQQILNLSTLSFGMLHSRAFIRVPEQTLKLSTGAQAHSKLVHKTPARFLGLVGATSDARTLPLSQRLENYRHVPH